MNFRKANGYLGVDISVAVIILLIFIPTITGMIYNISETNNSIERKAQSINIAVNAIEFAKSIDFSDLSGEVNNLILEKYGDAFNAFYENDSLTVELLQTEQDKLYFSYIVERDSVSYRVIIDMYKYQDIYQTANTLKVLDVVVNYHLGGEEKAIELSTTEVIE